MTSREAKRHVCKPGYWHVNVSPIGSVPDWQEQVMPHESGLLFGYEPSDLLAMQYKRSN